MSLDVGRVRGLVPALGDGWVRFDATAGMQVPEQVVSAVTAALRAPCAAPGGVFPASRRAAEIDEEARAAVADVVGADPAGVVLGPHPAVLLGTLADALSEGWQLGDEVVVSRLDEAAYVAPWLAAARRRGTAVRWAEIEIETCELPTWQFAELLDAPVRVVALTAASAQVGTRPEVAPIAEQARERGAFVVVDLTSAAPFAPQDIAALGADVVVLDAGAWGGPPVGALVFVDPSLLDELSRSSPDPSARGAHRLEWGPLPTAQLAGLVASVEHLAGLDETAGGTRRERVLASMAALEDYHSRLVSDLLDGLWATPVSVIGRPARRVPLLSVTHEAVKPTDAVEHLAERGICTFADPGEQGVLGHLGSAEIGGAIRIGFAHYTSPAEVSLLVDALLSLS
ncbi:aminotransferase class V-fold PLP-dependent enzyme [Pseudonocardia sp.]|uniref:aminotransferase class V-fold PLP-dependent enzyme n=1 Tax=Pseudonocardia sp. TaxID=60912 RepID=UPI003D0A59B3